MPRLRPKEQHRAGHVAPDDLVWAVVDLQRGGRYVHRGDRLQRDDPMVLEAPEYFEVKYPLTMEVTEGVNEDGR